MMRWAIWYHLYNLKIMKNTHGGVLNLILLKLTLLHGCFPRFSNCTNGSKSRNASHICFDKNFDRKYNCIFVLALLIALQPCVHQVLSLFFFGGIWIGLFDLNDGESDKNENIVISITFLVLKIRRIYSHAATKEKRWNLSLYDGHKSLTIYNFLLVFYPFFQKWL